MAQTGSMKVEDLSPAARLAVEKKSIEGGWDGRGLGRLLAELERWDDMAEARKSRAEKVFWTGAIGTGVGLFALAIASAVFETGMPLVILVVPIAAAVMGWKMKKAARAVDLPNEIRITVRPLIRQLRQDFHPDQKIKVSMNLAGIDEKVFKSERNLSPGPNNTIKQWTYEEPLCTIRLPLTDGSLVTLRMDNQYVKVQRTYRTSRGKSKSKTKWKKLSTVTAILLPQAPLSWEPARIEKFIDRANETVSFVEKDGVMAARLDRYYKFKAANSAPEDAAPAADVMKMLVRLSAMRPQAAGGAR